MESYQIVMLVMVGLIIVGSLLYYFLTQKFNHRRLSTIQSVLHDLFPMHSVIPSGVSFFDFSLEIDQTRYEFKVIPFDNKHELIITNPTYWCVNGDLKNWRRSTVPTLVSGVKEFIHYSTSFSGKAIKIGLIYPDCYNIIRYLNESDVAKVQYHDCVYGVYFVKLGELSQFFSKIK